MRNNNQAIVRKLTNKAMRSDKRRNIFVVIAVALTAFMITAVFSLGVSYFESMQMQSLRLQGTTSHFGFFYPSEEQKNEILELDYLRHVGITYWVGLIPASEQLGAIPFIHANRTQWEEIFLPAFTNVVGRYAEAENEVMISRHTLALMGITYPEIGMEIPITFNHFNTGEEITDIFILSKIFTDFAHMGMGTDGSIGIYTSYAFAKRLGTNILENTAINVIFMESNNVTEGVARLKADLSIPIHENQEYGMNEVFDADFGRVSTYVGFAAITAFLMLTGYLLIYNVMYMSVSRDVRFYGLLKTLGTTAKQIRRIVIGQALRLCVIGIPLGLVLAALTSFAIVPLYMEVDFHTGAVVSFSPIIFVGGTLFTTLTVYFASLTPAKKAAKVSPIESTRFAGENHLAKTYGSHTNGKPVKMAIRNIFREPKRARITILSLFIGIAVFTSAATLTNSLDIDYNINRSFYYDFTIVSSRRTDTLSWESANKFTEHFGDRAHISKLIQGGFAYTDAISGHVDFFSERDGIARDEVISLLYDRYGFGLKSTGAQALIEVADSPFHTNAEILDSVLTPENIAAFERGELAFLSIIGFDDWVNNTLVINERINSFTVGSVLDMYVGSDKIPAQIIFGGFVSLRIPPYGWSLHRGITEILVSDSFMEAFITPEHEENFATVDILSVNIDATTADEEYYYRVINSLLNVEEQLFSRIAERRFYEEALAMLFILGGGLAGILALIGAFNFINVMSASAIARKREFAILESVGMSKKQMRKTIRYEGMGYWIITILLSATVGNLIAYAFIRFIGSLDSAFSFTFPLVPILVIYAIILAICLVVPELVYRSMSKATLVERLREAE